MTRLSFALGYFHPWPNDAGLYVARAGGGFARAGIDAELRVVDPGRGDALEHLLSGVVDVAIAPINRVLARRALGQDVSILAAINQRGLESVRTRADSGITRLADLAGRSIALHPTPRGVAMVRTLVERDGGDPDAVRLVDVGARELDPVDGFSGLADASFGSYWSWDNLLTTHPADGERVWPVDEHTGFGYHSYVLATRASLVQDDPALVDAVVTAVGDGYRAAAADLDGARALFETVTPYLPAHALDASFRLIAPTWFHDGTWGTLRTELIGPYAAWLVANAAVPPINDWRDAVDPRLFDGANAEATA